jgi:hypothetical protein
MKSDTARSKIQLTSLPAASLGIEHWPQEQLGLSLKASIGVPATINDVLTQDVSLTRHHAELAFWLRYFTGVRPSAGAWLIQSVNQFQFENAQEQRPSVLMSRFIFSPGIRVGFERGFDNTNWWIRGLVGVSYPFFLRESPTDSGRPDWMLSYGGQITGCYRWTQRWSTQASFEANIQSFDHGGEATRAGGVKDVRVDDSYYTTMLALRMVL